MTVDNAPFTFKIGELEPGCSTSILGSLSEAYQRLIRGKNVPYQRQNNVPYQRLIRGSNKLSEAVTKSILASILAPLTRRLRNVWYSQLQNARSSILVTAPLVTDVAEIP